MKPIPWACPDFGEEEKQAIHRVVESGWMTMGKETEQFEAELAPITGKKHNIVFNSGTSAIVASLLALGVYRDGYKAHIPSYTYKATENAVYAAGIKTITYGNVNKDTGLMSPSESGDKHEVQIPVHYAGLPINGKEWQKAPLVVEDAAESFGSSILANGSTNPNHVRCFSFHAAKVITMIEGGCASTDSDQLAYRLRAVRVHGEDPRQKGVFITRGLNLKPLDVCSAVGRVQLRKLDKYLRNRATIATVYKEELELEVGFQRIPLYVTRHANMMFPIYVEKPMRVAEHLKKHKIGTRLGWQPLQSTEGADFMYRHTICLPMFNTMTPTQAIYVARRVNEVLR